jgi:hypothetical protein
MELSHGLHDPQPGPYRPLGVIFVRQGVAEVDQEPIAEVLSNVAIEAGDHLPASALIGPHQLAQLLGIKAFSEGGRTHEVAKHHRQLATLGLGSGFDSAVRDRR